MKSCRNKYMESLNTNKGQRMQKGHQHNSASDTDYFEEDKFVMSTVQLGTRKKFLKSYCLEHHTI